MSSLPNAISILYMYLQPIEFLLSICCNTLSLCILSTRTLRSSTCTYYVFAYTVFSMIYMIQICPIKMLTAFGIVWSQNVYGCKIQSYTIYLPTITAGFMLLLASFDRYCSTSNSFRLRSISTVEKARLFIVITTLIISIYLIPLFIVNNYDESTRQCIRSSSNILTLIFLGSQVFFIYIFIPFFLIIFGCLTAYNIHRSSLRVRGRKRYSQTERQLTRMLISQIGLYIIAICPYGVIFCMNSFFPSTLTPTMLIVREMFVLWIQTNFSTSFFVFIFAAKIYRKELIKLFRRTKIYPI